MKPNMPAENMIMPTAFRPPTISTIHNMGNVGPMLGHYW